MRERDRLAAETMSAPPLRLLLVRHGEVLSNRELRYVGSRDEPLADSGREQAGRLAAALAPLPLAAVYSSPLARTRATAERIAAARSLPLPLRLEARLREQSFGEWEGLTRAEVLARDAERLLGWEADLGTAPPGGSRSPRCRRGPSTSSASSSDLTRGSGSP